MIEKDLVEVGPLGLISFLSFLPLEEYLPSGLHFLPKKGDSRLVSDHSVKSRPVCCQRWIHALNSQKKTHCKNLRHDHQLQLLCVNYYFVGGFFSKFLVRGGGVIEFRLPFCSLSYPVEFPHRKSEANRTKTFEYECKNSFVGFVC